MTAALYSDFPVNFVASTSMNALHFLLIHMNVIMVEHVQIRLAVTPVIVRL